MDNTFNGAPTVSPHQNVDLLQDVLPQDGSTASKWGLYDPSQERSSCGVGFLTRKDSKQTHDLLVKGHEALCSVPHRGGMSSEGCGDGAGISVDLSVDFFRKVTGRDLEPGAFGVGNFFLPADESQHERAIAFINRTLADHGLEVIHERDVPVDNSVIGERSVKWQLAIRQWVFLAPSDLRGEAFDARIHEALLAIEAVAYTDDALAGLYPLSLSARMQVFKGRLNSWEIMPYYKDLNDPDHGVHTMYFHTRFSTNTDPHPSMAQPFRLMAHKRRAEHRQEKPFERNGRRVGPQQIDHPPQRAVGQLPLGPNAELAGL